MAAPRLSESSDFKHTQLKRPRVAYLSTPRHLGRAILFLSRKDKAPFIIFRPFNGSGWPSQQGFLSFRLLPPTTSPPALTPKIVHTNSKRQHDFQQSHSICSQNLFLLRVTLCVHLHSLVTTMSRICRTNTAHLNHFSWFYKKPK